MDERRGGGHQAREEWRQEGAAGNAAQVAEGTSWPKGQQVV